MAGADKEGAGQGGLAGADKEGAGQGGLAELMGKRRDKEVGQRW